MYNFKQPAASKHCYTPQISKYFKQGFFSDQY